MEPKQRDLAELASELHRLELARRERMLGEESREQRRQLLAELTRHLSTAANGERRRELRVPAQLTATFHYRASTITCEASELSMSGLALCGCLWVTEEEDLVLTNLRTGDLDYPLEVSARVVWRVLDEEERPRAGLEFQALDRRGQRQIGAVFDELLLQYLGRLSAGG